MASYTLKSGLRLKDFNDSWRQTALDVIASIPSTWNGHTVTLLINSIKRPPVEGKRSFHNYGLACDLNIVLDGVTVLTGTYPNCKAKNSKVNIGNDSYTLYEVYSELLGKYAKLKKCRWGGDFRIWDPMHFDSGSGFIKGLNLNESDGDEIIIYENVIKSHPALDLTPEAGNYSRLETKNPIKDVSNTRLYIGYDISLSDFSTNQGVLPLKDILDRAKIPQDLSERISQLSGLQGDLAYQEYSKNKELSISEEQSSSILNIMILDIIKYLRDFHEIDTSKYEIKISTAIISYFYGKNLATESNVKDIKDIKDIIISSRNIHVDLARFIENKSDNLPPDIKSRRMMEVQLLRSFKDPETPVTSITSSSSENNYQTELDLYGNLIDTQKQEIKRLLKERKLFGSDPASSEYDETFNDLDQSTIDALSDIMQAHQVNTDKYFSYNDYGYEYRLKTKIVYAELSRVLNYKIQEVEDLLDNEKILKNHSEYNINKSNTMLPYSDGISYTVKKNAVNRCLYRIKLIEHKIKKMQSKLVSYGFSNITNALTFSQVQSSIGLNVVTSNPIEYITGIVSLSEDLVNLKRQKELEYDNLNYLKKESLRYS